MVRLCRYGVAAVLVLVLGSLLGCFTPMGQEAAELLEEPSQSSADASVQAYDAAAKAVATSVSDAVLLSAGSQGVALADTPSQWSYLFVSPSTDHLWRVMVDHGDPGQPEDMGKTQVEQDTAGAIDFGTIKVGAAQAIALARESASSSGEVPPNVMVAGFFVPSPDGAPVDLTPGVWTVTFIEGTSMEGSRAFDVDMMTGAVTETSGK